MTSTATAEVDLEDEVDDGLNFRCGWGGTPRCETWLPRRGCCPQHRAAILVAAARARVGPPAETAKFIERALKLDPSIDADLGEAGDARAAKVDGRVEQRAAATQRAAERRDETALLISAFVREADELPVTRAQLAAAFGIGSGAPMSAAIAASDVYYVVKGSPKPLAGCWRDRGQFEAAVIERAAAEIDELAAEIAAYVASRGGPLQRRELEAIFNVLGGAKLTKALALAHERQMIFTASTKTLGGGVPRALAGSWPSRQAFEQALSGS